MLATINNDIIYDNTIYRTDSRDKRAQKCPKCGSNDAVYFMHHDQFGEDMSLIYVCKKCRNKFISGGHE